MKLFQGFSVFFMVCATLAQDVTEQEHPQEEGRQLRNYNQDWRAVDYLSPLHDTSGWIPHHQSETEEQPLKRRRIRKRKRRPPVFTSDPETDESVSLRRRRPQIKEPWEEMNEEIQKTNSRRRLTPIYNESDEVATPKIQYEKIRDPFTALQEAEEKQKTKVEESATPDLKTLLKQSGGLSLSEVLQQKNLTLSELLKGNRQAISVLAQETETTTQVVTSTETPKYRRLPPSLGMKKDKNFVRNHEDDRLSSDEVVTAQRKRLALLHSHKDTKMFSDIPKVEVVTEQTTERRIFVPSEGYKVSVETTQGTTSKPRIRKLPMTSAKLNKVVSQSGQESVSTIPDRAVSISLNEIFGFNIFHTKNDTDEPFKMVIDLGEITTVLPEVKTSESQNLDELTPTTTTSLGEKMKQVTAKEEIMEILNNPVESEQLSNILRTRNMSVDELVALRERGSSQLHLADIFHNETREPEPKDDPFIGHIMDDDSSVFNRKGKTIPIVAEILSSTQSSEPKLTTTKPPYTITSFPKYKIESNTEAKVQPFFPIWEQLYPDFFSENSNQEIPGIVQPTTAPEKVNFEEVEQWEEIENSLAEAANGRLKVDLPHVDEDEDEEKFISLPSGVKSAILASLAIIGLSLLVFVTILLIFKWTQKQKRLNYSGSFLGSRIRSPILEPQQKRTFRTFVSETLGRKKNYYKAHVQSMSDSFWDKDEKKSYMI